MLDAVLTRKNVSFKFKITIKTMVSVGLIALAVILPQIIHATLGASGGSQWLPMYLPVLIGGCLLGCKWGLGVGIMSPIVSFLITLAFGNAMPALSRLPYMVAELAVFATVSGAFSKKIADNVWIAFPVVLLAAIAGRSAFLLLAAIFQSISPLTIAVVWGQIQTGLAGVLLQAVIVPLVVIAISFVMNFEKSNN